jgi:hypothetical protein
VTATFPTPEDEPDTIIRKNPEVPVLADYKSAPPPSFWQYIPFQPLPLHVQTPVNVPAFRHYVMQALPSWPFSVRVRAMAALQQLEHGAQAVLTHPLQTLFSPNMQSAFEHGPFITDNIVSWLKAGFVCGPFSYPPLPNLRVNPLKAVEQHDKIRPCLNLSHPIGSSYNDALFKPALIRPIMSSARIFAYRLYEAGKNANFSKFDMKTAYKNVPQHPSVWPYQGFYWQTKFFIDISTVFGSGAAPSQFDVFSATVQFIAQFLCLVPVFFILRQLDDLVILSPSYSTACQQFSAIYQQLCSQLNIKIAPPCPKKEKAFLNSHDGVVLGIYFNSESMTWAVPHYKFVRYIRCIDAFLSNATVCLDDLHSLCGYLNDFALFSPFFKAFKAPIFYFLHEFKDDTKCRLPIPHQVCKDLHFWRQAIFSATQGFPLSFPPQGPPFTALVFYSDAAGGVFPMYERLPHMYPKRGAASIGGQSPEDAWFHSYLSWPPSLLSSTLSSALHAFGHKSSTLEAVALCLPLLTIPNLCRNRHICFYTDNKALVSGWETRYLLHDPETSLWLRCLSVFEAFLDCHFYIFHSPRNSSPITTLADKLTRDPVPLPSPHPPPMIVDSSTHPNLFSWLHSPVLSWDLPTLLLSDTVKVCNFVIDV